MYFGTKSYLKSNYYHTPKHPLKMANKFMLIVRLMDIFNAYLIFLMNNIFYIFLTQIKNK